MRLVSALLSLLLVAGSACAKDNWLLEQEAQDGWILLFDGESLFGWTQEGGARWRVANGELLADAGDSAYLRSNSAFADFILKCDFRLKAEGESGVFLRIGQEGKPLSTGYKLQINNKDSQFPTGSLVNHLKAAGGQASPNQWHTYEVEAVGDHFVVRLDGRQVLSGEAKKSKAGFIGLQYVAGTPVEFRNLKLKPLNLQPIFNGQNLYEWKQVGPQAEPKKKGKFMKLIPVGGGGKAPAWSVQDGAIHINKGPSQLETNSFYDDFILRIRIRAESRSKSEHPSGGVFLRAEKGVLSTGYKVQINNGYKGVNRTQPLDYGTGGLYSLRNARRVLSDDNQFFTETVVARSHHIEVWVNGYPVSDFEDYRPEGADALIQARTVPGTISLEAHNPSSILDFKDVRIVALPKAGAAAAAESSLAAQAAQPVPPGMAAPSAPGYPGSVQPAGNPHQKEISRLTQQALNTSDPVEQVKIYDRILALDPNNLVAYNARKDAQERADKLRADQAQQEAERAQQERQKQTQEGLETTKRDALKQAENAFLVGNLPAATSRIAVARRIDPTDPEVMRLDSLIGKEVRARRTKAYILYGVIGFIPAFFILLLILRRRKKDAYLEIVDGLDKGRRYNIDQDVIHIGAVEQDGGNRNEIVIRDVEKTVSRFHCEMHRQNGKFYIFDCNSANGTYLEGRRLPPGEPVRVKSGTRVQLAEACTLELGFEKRRKN